MIYIYIHIDKEIVMTHTHSKHSKIIDLRQVTLTELREAMEELKSNKPCRGGWAAEGNEKGGEML